MKKKHNYSPDPELLKRFPDVSGNAINGLGERQRRQPARFFWHPADQHPFGELQQYIVTELRPASGEDRSFRNPHVDRGPSPVAINPQRAERSAANWADDVKAFALDHEADLVGVAAMQPDYVFEGYQIEEPWVVVMGFQHDYQKLARAPATESDPAAYHDLHEQYNRGARAANKLANHIRGYGYQAQAFPGPMADALAMIPAAVAAGLGELGKHGSMINRQFGSAFRLSAVTTDLPLVPDAPDVFGADDFCTRCQVCRQACPPDAIFDDKQWVRGEKKWYVDFDKCIPYFGENYACGICIAVCPWSRPGLAENLIVKMARRRRRPPKQQS